MAEELQKRQRPAPGPEIIVKFREGGSLKDKKDHLEAQHISLKRFERTLGSRKGAVARRSFDMKQEDRTSVG